MKKIITCIGLLLSLHAFANTESPNACRYWMAVARPICEHLRHILHEGDTDIFFSGYAWHNRYTYTPERIKKYNEAAWGTGLGKGLFNQRGDWEELYAIGFLDSHRHVEPAAGYAYLKVLHLGQELKTGLGLTAIATQRSDIFNGIPFAGVLPTASIFYKRFAISATYVPGAVGAGNVLYVAGKYTI